MKTEVKKIDELKREINIYAGGEAVKDKYEDAFRRINQKVKVPGFRPGNIPQDILEKKFSADANELVLKELIPDLYSEALKKEMLDVAELPEISDVKLNRQTLSFKAVVYVMPQINIRDYKGIKLEYKKTEVTSDDIKRAVDALKEMRKIDTADDRLARSLGYPNLAALEKIIEAQLFIQKEDEKRKYFEETVIEAITKDLDFKIPHSMIQRQLQELLRQAKLDMTLKGIAEEKIEQDIKTLSQELLPQAKKQVRVYLVLSDVAKKENIPLDDQMPRKVIELLLREAEWVERE